MQVRGSWRLVPFAVLALCVAWVLAHLLTRDGTPAPDSLPNRRETARCVIWTDLEGERLDFHARFFEGFWDWFEQEYYRVPPAAKVPILLFSEDADFTAFRTASGGPDTPFAWYEWSVDGECMLVVNLSTGLGGATHELVHHFVRLGFGERAPLWMNEGFAQFFEKFMGHIDASGTLQISFGYFSNWRFPAARQRVETLSLARLVQDPVGNVGLRALFLFLHNIRSTLIPAVTIPVSLIGTFAFMKLLGFSINTLTLFGLVLATGTVVDDAIVVIENIERHMREYGKSAMQAAVDAMNEVFSAVIVIGIVLVAVFVPVAFFPGTTGRLYQQFSLTIAFSVILSVFNAVTLTPALAALLLDKESHTHGWFFTAFNKGVERGTNGYVRLARGALRFRYAVLMLFAVGLFATWTVFRLVPSSFVPQEDEGYFMSIVQAPAGASLEYSTQIAAQAEKILQNDPDIVAVFSVMGFSFTGAAPNTGMIFARLKDYEERKRPDQSLAAVLQRVSGQLFMIPGAIVVAFPPPSIQGLGFFGGLLLMAALYRMLANSRPGTVRRPSSEVQVPLADDRVTLAGGVAGRLRSRGVVPPAIAGISARAELKGVDPKVIAFERVWIAGAVQLRNPLIGEIEANVVRNKSRFAEENNAGRVHVGADHVAVEETIVDVQRVVGADHAEMGVLDDAVFHSAAGGAVRSECQSGPKLAIQPAEGNRGARQSFEHAMARRTE